MRTPFAIKRQIQLAVMWYGTEYTFERNELDQYGEPIESVVQTTVEGIYHATGREFIELLNTEGTSVKSKISKGIVCPFNEDLNIQQGDSVIIHDVKYHVTTVEPVFYSEEVVAQEISLEEFAEGVDDV